ncbi:MAG: ABC transporter permease [Lachnospiraceae bacterium]|nr:ABC transporter permease [Lachnospiraceae bacterium]
MLSLRNLPFRNLKGYAGRTAALLIFAMLMTVAIFGGTMVIGGVRNGLETVESRLGADIMVTPSDAKNEFDAQTVLLQAEPGYFYMDRGKLDEIARVEGVEKVSPQLFMASAKAGCCSARLQMIAFDPASDFSIQPWIADTATDGEMGLMDVIVGSNVTVYEDRIIRFYDKECRIIGQFAPTGSTLDNCVYMNFDTVKELIEASFAKGLNIYSEYDPDNVISDVMIKVAPGADITAVAEAIQNQVSGVSVVTSKNMVSGIGDSLRHIAGSVSVFTVIFWIIGMLMTILIFTLMMNERKREFASLTAMGAGKGILSGIVTGEAFSVNLLGGIAGIVLSVVILSSFKNLIGQGLGVGFVLPSIATMLLLALVALLAVILTAAISSRIVIGKLSRMDASLVLKEGE